MMEIKFIKSDSSVQEFSLYSKEDRVMLNKMLFCRLCVRPPHSWTCRGLHSWPPLPVSLHRPVPDSSHNKGWHQMDGSLVAGLDHPRSAHVHVLLPRGTIPQEPAQARRTHHQPWRRSAAVSQIHTSHHGKDSEGWNTPGEESFLFGSGTGTTRCHYWTQQQCRSSILSTGRK